MSSFNNKGLRSANNYMTKKTKQHVKAFYQIMDQMEELAKILDPSKEYTEENINDYVQPMYRALDPMEKFVLLGKLNNIKERNEAKSNAS